ncbi:MAG TPA: hypothetical protein PKU91_00475 [Phycisphaerales bacterium]|nr:hypothetical protein [Phycisphaerales bacterium]
MDRSSRVAFGMHGARRGHAGDFEIQGFIMGSIRMAHAAGFVAVVFAALGISILTNGNARAAPQDCVVEHNKPWGCGTKYICVLLYAKQRETQRVIKLHDPVREPSEWKTTRACDCRVPPCGRQRQCPPMMAVKSQELKTCWTFGGSASVEAKVGMLIELLGKLGVTVTAELSREGCVTVSEAVQYHVPWEQCFDTHGRDVIITRSGESVETSTEYVFTWRVWDGVAGVFYDIDVPCNESTTVVNVKAGVGHEFQIAPYPERCGSIVPDPDPYDSKRSDPCCSPLPPCDPPPPDGKICCGCEGSR